MVITIMSTIMLCMITQPLKASHIGHCYQVYYAGENSTLTRLEQNKCLFHILPTILLL
jgi:hypothetical protein